MPDVELRPVRERKHAHALALASARVVDAPELGALLLRIPPVLRRAEREDTLLGARLLLVSSGSTDGRVEPVLVECLPERLGLHGVGVQARPVAEGIDTRGQSLLVHVN